jgi:hypothetical protein
VFWSLCSVSYFYDSGHQDQNIFLVSISKDFFKTIIVECGKLKEIVSLQIFPYMEAMLLFLQQRKAYKH